MRSSDIIIIGGGIIGLSLAIELRKKGLSVLIVERGEPGREASYAAAGMIADTGDELPPPLQPLAHESARMYPEFAHELEDESGIKVDLRDQGTIVLSSDGKFPDQGEPLSPQRLKSLEPGISTSLLTNPGRNGVPVSEICAAYLHERSLDPRALVAAALKAARHRNVSVSSGAEVKSLITESGRVAGVQTDNAKYASEMVVNCAGAWAGAIAPFEFPVKPIKGQMLSVVEVPRLQHVIRSEQVYLVPRSDGRLLLGSTLEDVGYNKQTDITALQRLFDAAVGIFPGIKKSLRHEAWAGLRPAALDDMPILGETPTSGYFVATGHYRDGILLAPITAKLMSDVIAGQKPRYDLSPFSPTRF